MHDLPDTATEAVSRTLESVDDWEPSIDAWEVLDGPAALSAAAAIDSAAERGGIPPLRGLVIGVKDVIDVAGLPTRAGSRSRAGASPATKDAALVGSLRAAGAVVLGKTRSTEYAFTDPTTTRNPHHPAFTPGGSSSGSGAAVGAGVVPLALGTQTAGSLCRPAAYCGATSYKPTRSRLSTRGMVPLSQAFDTVGFIARSCELSAAVMHTVDRHFARETGAVPEPGSGIHVGLFRSDLHADAERAQRQALADAGETLRAAGARVSEFDDPISAPALIKRHETVMLYEAGLNHGHLLDGHSNALQPKFRDSLERAGQITAAERNAAGEWLLSATDSFWEAVGDFDVILANPVPGPAPRGFSGTGVQSYLTPWTVFGGPLATLPWGVAGNGMPLSILLAARPGADAMLLSVAVDLERRMPALPAPAPRSIHT